MMPSAPDAALVDLFRSMRSDSRSDPKATRVADLAGIELVCDTGSLATPLTVGMGGTIEVPFDCKIQGARIYLGKRDAASSATIDLQHGTFADYPITSALYSTIPVLTTATKVDLDISAWRRYLGRREVLTWELASFSGTASRITLALWLIKIGTASGSSTVIDGSNNTLVDSSGNTLTFRR